MLYSDNLVTSQGVKERDNIPTPFNSGSSNLVDLMKEASKDLQMGEGISTSLKEIEANVIKKINDLAREEGKTKQSDYWSTILSIVFKDERLAPKDVEDNIENILRTYTDSEGDSRLSVTLALTTVLQKFYSRIDQYTTMIQNGGCLDETSTKNCLDNLESLKITQKEIRDEVFNLRETINEKLDDIFIRRVNETGGKVTSLLISPAKQLFVEISLTKTSFLYMCYYFDRVYALAKKLGAVDVRTQTTQAVPIQNINNHYFRYDPNKAAAFQNQSFFHSGRYATEIPSMADYHYVHRLLNVEYSKNGKSLIF